MESNIIDENKFRLDFIGIGASKAGTTWIAETLKKHPEICLPLKRKEMNFFNQFLAQDFRTENWEYKKPYSWYHSFFDHFKKGQVAGEITPSYLSMGTAPDKIHAYNPAIKLFAVLRHPIERSFSEYLFSRQNGVNPYSNFEEAIRENPVKYLNGSLYFSNLKRFFDLFPAYQIKILFYDDLKMDNRKFMSELYSFLSVGHFFPEKMDEPINTGQQPKNQMINNIIGRTKLFIHSKRLYTLLPMLRKSGLLKIATTIKKKNLTNQVRKEVISAGLRQELLDFYFNDIEKLEKLTGRDLSSWKV